MPFLKKIKKETLAKQWERKAQQCGLLHTVYSVNGNEYTGHWLDNKKHGKGTFHWKKAEAVYDGDWINGKRSGFGTMRRLHPIYKEFVMVYSGGWKDDKKEGFGTYFYNESAYYEGEWSKDKRSGRGRMYYENGDLYEGEWEEDKQHGQGLLRLANRNRYEGQWKDGMKNGPGKFFYLDKGQVYEGVWLEGIAKCGKVTDFGREAASDPTIYPIPKVHLMDPDSVLMEAQSRLLGINPSQ